MSELDAAVLNWSDLGVNDLVPTGTVTLLLADVEGSTRLWETQPEEMTAAFANLDHVLAETVPVHRGVRPIEQGEGDSFVIAFGRASDAVACALELQRAMDTLIGETLVEQGKLSRLDLASALSQQWYVEDKVPSVRQGQRRRLTWEARRGRQRELIQP